MYWIGTNTYKRTVTFKTVILTKNKSPITGMLLATTVTSTKSFLFLIPEPLAELLNIKNLNLLFSWFKVVFKANNLKLKVLDFE